MVNGKGIIYTEENLIAGILKRDINAFNYLYDHYGGALLNCIASIVRERDLAADILQNVFIKVYTKMALYEASKGRLFTWMLTIARNEAYDLLRQKGYKINAKTLEWESLTDTEPLNPYHKIDADDIRRTVLNLTPDLRNLIELSFFTGIVIRK